MPRELTTVEAVGPAVVAATCMILAQEMVEAVVAVVLGGSSGRTGDLYSRSPCLLMPQDRGH